MGPRERELLLEAFDSNWVAPAGPDLARFEEAVAQRCGRAYAVALSSGTAAIHLGLIASGVTSGDSVAVSSFTFAGSVNPIRYVGASPLFIDSAEDTWNMSPALLDEALGRCEREGRRLPKAVMAVDLYGQTPDMDKIAAVCAQHGVLLVEDAAEAIGATSFGRPAGSFGSWSAVSFNGNKIITTGGGGALVTDDRKLAEHVRYLSTQAKMPHPHYEHTEVGYNYRLSNLLAAIGRAQMENLMSRIERRRAIEERYTESLGDVPGISFLPHPTWCRPNHWLTCVRFDDDVWGADANERMRCELELHDIEGRKLWKPMHQQPVFQEYESVLNGVSDRLFATGLCLPSGSSMTDGDVARVVAVVRSRSQ